MFNRYYTPSIEEFHIGFEYEYMNGDRWEQGVIVPSDFSTYSRGDEHYENWFEEIYTGLRDVRVKYLSSKDLEETGWVFDGYPNGWYVYKDYQLIEHRGEYSVSSDPPYAYSITRGNFPTPWEYTNIYKGPIKNISEYKRLMERLDIIKFGESK